MNPTVSVSTNGARPPPETSRAAGSSVTKSWSAVGALAPAIRLRRVVLPAFVYPDQRRDRQADVAPVRPEQPPVALDVREGLVNLPDAPPDHAPVRLELRLAGSPGPDAAPESLEVGPLPHQARQEVRELRQLHLELALARPRPLGEDVEDQGGAVDDAKLQRAGEVPLLHGRQRIVRDQETGPEGPGQVPHLLHLALPEVEARVPLGALLDDAGERPPPRRSRPGGSTPPSTPPPPSASGGGAGVP